jgi:hypothetical protein
MNEVAMTAVVRNGVLRQDSNLAIAKAREFILNAPVALLCAQSSWLIPAASAGGERL